MQHASLSCTCSSCPLHALAPSNAPQALQASHDATRPMQLAIVNNSYVISHPKLEYPGQMSPDSPYGPQSPSDMPLSPSYIDNGSAGQYALDPALASPSSQSTNTLVNGTYNPQSDSTLVPSSDWPSAQDWASGPPFEPATTIFYVPANFCQQYSGPGGQYGPGPMLAYPTTTPSCMPPQMLHAFDPSLTNDPQYGDFDSYQRYGTPGSIGSSDASPDSTSRPIKPPRDRRNPRQRDPHYIPRPANPFICFRQEWLKRLQRGEIEYTGPRDQRNMSFAISTDWNGLSEREKGRYRKEAATKKAAHMAKYPDYKYAPKQRERKDD